MKVVSDTLEDVLASASQYAVHPLGGITRKIYLMAVPEIGMAGFDLTTTFDSAYRDAIIHCDVDIANEGLEIPDSLAARFRLRDGNNNLVNLPDNIIDLGDINSGLLKRYHVKLSVDQPQKWDSEHPNLYYLECELIKGNQVIEIVRRRFGFRQVEIRGSQVFVNNRPVKLRGVCRHEVHPLRGRSLTLDLWRKDAELFRAANVNYIRTSHYPPAEEFLDFCDELGLFVECEAPLCWVQHGANANWNKPGWDYLDRKFYDPLLRANLENIKFNRNHPSIIMWSLANESRWSPLWADVLEAVEKYDPSRPTVFHDQSYGNYNNAGSQAQIANMHYPGVAGPDQAAKMDRPLLFGEYCHLNCYNRHELVSDPGLRNAWGRGFKSMWDNIYHTPGCLGGAIWSGIDDTFHLPGGHTVGYGSWGLIDGWRRPKPEYWHVKKVYSPVRISQTDIQTPLSGHQIDIPVENRHNFTNLNELEIVGEIAGLTQTITADIPPHSKGILKVKCPENILNGQKLYLSFKSPLGFMIDEYILNIGAVPQTAIVEAANRPGIIDVSQKENDYVIKGENYIYVIDKQTGQLKQGITNEQLIINGGPKLMVLPMNNKGGTQMTKDNQTFSPYTAICANHKVNSVALEQQDNDLIIKVRDQYDLAQGGYSITIKNDGRLTMDYEYEMIQAVNPRQWGMVISLPKEFDTLNWRRNGLWTTYPPDHIARIQGTATAFVNTNLCGPLGPRQQPDNPWRLDGNELGSNDFRSTKENIFHAGLSNQSGQSLKVVSDGNQHVRTWAGSNAIHLLIAEYSNAGSEGFFRSHASVEDKHLNVKDAIKGTIKIIMN